MEKLVKEIPFGKAIARVTVHAWMSERNWDGYVTGQQLNTSKTVEIVKDGKVTDHGYHAQVVEYGEGWKKLYEQHNLDKAAVFTRVGDRAMTAGREAADAINAAIKEMTAELVHSFGEKTEAEKEVEEAIEEAKAIVAAAEKEGVDKLMSAAEIKAWRKQYNEIHNEGGEGYIPTRISRERYEKARRILNGLQWPHRNL